MPEAEPLATPAEPESLDRTGLTEAIVEQLIFKILYFRGDLYGQDLSAAIGLRFSVIQDIVETLKLRHQIVIKRSLGMGNVGALFSLSEAGRERAREYLENNHYSGPAPVPLDQYAEMVRQQRPREGWLTREALARAFRGMVVTERLLSQIGPAVASCNSFLLYGKPGDGKTYLVESLSSVDPTPIFLPYALECQGNIIQLFDPIYHHPVEEEQAPALSISVEQSYDRRWVKCRRPFIVSGGELTMDMLDLRYNESSRIYEAPFQLKANNGIYLVDDFGRQIARPAEVLNRWIVPMERRVDYLTFLTGGKVTAPFEAFLIFSTNLNPADLGDEAFLRRIQYKMLLHGPGENEFIRIFENLCTARKIPFTRDLILRFIERRFKATGKALRRCHPRDILSHALDLIHYERLPCALTSEILDRAYESCFVQDDSQAPVESKLLFGTNLSCADFWNEKVDQIQTAFGTLAFAGGYRDRASGSYREADSARTYGEAETSRALLRIHNQSFTHWLGMNLQQQSRDLSLYLAEAGIDLARFGFEYKLVADRLAPADAKPEEVQLFVRDLETVLETLMPRQAEAPELEFIGAPLRRRTA